MYGTPKFTKGDRVRVRNLNSRYHGSVVVIKASYFKEGVGFSYTVELQWLGHARLNSFVEQELEKVK